MDGESDWNALREGGSSAFGIAGMGILRFTLLFGSAAVALALIIAPIAENRTRDRFVAGGLDRMATGSVPQGNTYTVRRSVLQSSPNAICVIQNDGSRRGDCN